MAYRAGSRALRVHPVPLAIALLIVAAAVLVGIYGRRLDERPTGALVPMGEVVDALRQMEPMMHLDAVHRPPGTPTPTPAEIAELVTSTTGSTWRPPDLAPEGYVPIIGGPVELPGCDGGGSLLYERAGTEEEGAAQGSDRFLLLFFTMDHGRFVTFDPYGRVEPLATAQSFTELDDTTDPGSPATLAYSNGELVLVYRTLGAEALERIRGVLGPP